MEEFRKNEEAKKTEVPTGNNSRTKYSQIHGAQRKSQKTLSAAEEDDDNETVRSNNNIKKSARLSERPPKNIGSAHILSEASNSSKPENIPTPARPSKHMETM